MAYLDNSEIIVDAILTKKGREKLAAGQSLNITYLPNVSAENMTLNDLVAAMKQKLQERQQDELDRGLTLVGPHHHYGHLDLNPSNTRSHFVNFTIFQRHQSHSPQFCL